MKKHIVPYVAVGLISVFWVYPIILIMLNSFKSYNEMITNFTGFPTSFSFTHFKETWEMFRFPHLLKNTLFYTVSSVAVIALIAPMAAYQLARTKSKLSNLFFFLIILPMMVPFQTYMITLIRFLSNLGLIGTMHGYIFVQIGLCMPLAVFMIHGFVKGIPVEIGECAYIDGASQLRTYFSIILPLLAPILATVIVIDALAIWNDVITNMLILGSKPETINLQQALYMKFSANTSDWEHALPGITMSTIPNILFFVFLQKYVVAGVTAGAVKG